MSLVLFFVITPLPRCPLRYYIAFRMDIVAVVFAGDTLGMMTGIILFHMQVCVYFNPSIIIVVLSV